MAALNLSIFHAYDIRGRYPDKFNEAAAEEISRAFVELVRRHGEGLKPDWLAPVGPIVVSRDGRNSSPQLAAAVIRGLVAGGNRVIDAGITTTPLHNFILVRHDVAGGLMVTASHNPPEYNGLKLALRGAVSLPEFGGLDELRQIMKQGNVERGPAGSVETADYTDEYVSFLAERAPTGEFRVALDAGNGATAVVLPKLLDRLPNIVAERLNFELDGSFPGRGPNPLTPGVLTGLQETVRVKGCQLGAAFDGDGDRVLFVDETGAIVRTDFVTAILAKSLLREHKGAVVYDVRHSRIVPETIREAGGEPVSSPVGYIFVKKAMRALHGVFGGELSGHYYYPEMGYAESAMLTMLRLLGAMAETRESLSRLIAPLQKYVQSGEVNFHVADPAATIEKIAAHYVDAKQSRLDGLTVEYPEWWFNLRPSNTEPLVRLNVEANDSATLASRQAELAAFINSRS